MKTRLTSIYLYYENKIPTQFPWNVDHKDDQHVYVQKICLTTTFTFSFFSRQQSKGGYVLSKGGHYYFCCHHPEPFVLLF